MSAVKFYLKCTTCKTVREATEAQLLEAKDIGCAFSSCCSAVATFEQVKVNFSKPKKISKK